MRYPKTIESDEAVWFGNMQICILEEMCLISDKLLSKVTPRFRADSEGEITSPQKTIDADWILFVAEGCHYEEFSLDGLTERRLEVSQA